MAVTNLQTSLRSVFGGLTGAIVSNPQYRPRAWPLFKLVAPHRVDPTPAELADVVASQIVPRLISAHGVAASPYGDEVAEAPCRPARLEAVAAESFAALLISGTNDAVMGVATGLLADGMTETAVYSGLLSPTAKVLCELWRDDRASYADVTIGFGRLVRLIHDLEWTTQYNGEDDARAPSVLFAPRPGEEQTFGLYLLQESFRWSGWRAAGGRSATDEMLIANLEDESFDVLCLGITRENDVAGLSGTIGALRKASRNPDLAVLLSGGPIIGRTALIALVGADGTVSNSGEALSILAARRPALAQ